MNPALSLGALPACAVTFEDWRRALQGQPMRVMPQVAAVLVPVELPPLPVVRPAIPPQVQPSPEVKASIAPAPVSTSPPVWTMKGRLPAAPVPVVTPDDEYPDPEAIWNASPSRVELFLSRYHHQTFTAFAIAALVLLWAM